MAAVVLAPRSFVYVSDAKGPKKRFHASEDCAGEYTNKIAVKNALNQRLGACGKCLKNAVFDGFDAANADSLRRVIAALSLSETGGVGGTASAGAAAAAAVGAANAGAKNAGGAGAKKQNTTGGGAAAGAAAGAGAGKGGNAAVAVGGAGAAAAAVNGKGGAVAVGGGGVRNAGDNKHLLVIDAKEVKVRARIGEAGFKAVYRAQWTTKR